MNQLFSSSANPNQASTTLKNFIPLILLIAGLFGVQVTDVALNNVVDLIVDAALSIGIAITAVLTLWGTVKKLLVQVGIIKPKE